MSDKVQYSLLGDRSVKVKCPATVANLVCGFDILGMALNNPFDLMELKLIDRPEVIIKNKDSFKGNSSEKTWLTSILKNKIIDYYRKKKPDLSLKATPL